jgi:hypothetical protein
MKRLALGVAALGLLAACPLPGQPAQAQLLNQLGGGTTGSGPGGGSMLGGLTGGSGGLPPVSQAGAGNTAGVLQYCIKNNYLSGGSAASVKNSLMSKVSGSSRDSGFSAGNNGVLQTGNGQSYSLGGGGLKAQATHKVCDMVLQHAKSML